MAAKKKSLAPSSVVSPKAQLPVQGPPAPRQLSQGASSRSVAFSLGTTYYDAGSWTDHRRDWFWTACENADDRLFDTWTRATVLSRLRREARNNPLAKGLIEHFSTAIGASNMRSVGPDAGYNSAKDAWWKQWAKYCEPSGLNLFEVEEIIWMEMLVAGEIFVVLLKSGQIQLVPSEYCTGIEYNGRGRAQTYKFQAADGNGFIDPKAEPQSVDARYVIHVYKQDRVHLGRGIPWLIASLVSLRDLYELHQAKTKQIKDAGQIFGWLKRTPANMAAPFNGLGAGYIQQGGESPDAPANPAATGGTATGTGPAAQVPQISLRDGTVIALESGEDLTLSRPEYQAADHEKMMVFLMHTASTPLGLPVELWWSGLGDVNYSGFKGLGVQWDGRRKRHSAWFEQAFLNPLQFWRSSKAINEGDIPAAPGGRVDNVVWGWARTPVLDIEKEAKAAISRIAAGISSVGDELEKEGKDLVTELTKRRAQYIAILVASGELEPGADTAAVKVPKEFLINGLVAGTEKVDGVEIQEAAGATPADAKAKE